MGEILFLAHRLPFPPDRGDKIRSHHVLRRLADIGPVHVGTFADSDADFAHRHELAALASSHCLVARKKSLLRAGIEALAVGQPVSFEAFRDHRLEAYVHETLARHPIGTIYVFSGQMGQYVPKDFGGQILLDLVDVDSAKFEAYGNSGLSARRWIDRREARLLAREEERLARCADRTMFVSEAEAALFRSRLSDPGGICVSVLGNGTDTAFFDPRKVAPEPDLVSRPGPHLVFAGQMDYPPNIAAARRLVERILPAIRKIYPQAMAHVVGRNPDRSLQALNGREGCRIWGEVPDIRPFVAAADLVVAPLEIARGVQNKILEAMAMARPVLLTPEAATGIGGEDGVHFVVAGADGAIAAKAIDLLSRPGDAANLGRAARRFVMQHCAWDAMLAPLNDYLARSPFESDRDAA